MIKRLANGLVPLLKNFKSGCKTPWEIYLIHKKRFYGSDNINGNKGSGR
jgi:hypothetical protein